MRRVSRRPEVACGEGVFPFPLGWGLGRGLYPFPENFGLFNLEMMYFGAHLRYSDVLVLKFCF